MGTTKLGRACTILSRLGQAICVIAVVGLVGCKMDPRADLPQTATQSLTVTHEFSVLLPKEAKLLDVALAASDSLDLGTDTSVLTGTGSGATVTNVGAVRTSLGVRARTGTLWSQASVLLENRAQVDGDLLTDVTPELGTAPS